MEQSERQHRLDLLLDYHLDRLDADERALVEGWIESDPALRASSRQLHEVLRPLDAWTVPAAGPDLADNVLRAIDRSRKLRALSDHPEWQAAATGAASGGGSRGFFFTGRELLAAAACILLVFSLLVPGISKVRRDARRGQCASNMHAIHEGLSSYQAMFTTAVPFTSGIPGAAWLPSGDGALRRPTQSNSRHPYRILKLRLVPRAEAFTCPADDAAPMNAADIPGSEDFTDFRNNSYDSMNMAGGFPEVQPPPSTVYLSDHNPLFVRGRFDDSVDADQANSPNHGGRGQNVMRLDGSVEWLTSPVIETRGDNLWLMGDRRQYDGTETLDDPSDGWMIPGFPKGAPPPGEAAQRKP
jgi:hypothetical protein